jgi:hypothetical protein
MKQDKTDYPFQFLEGAVDAVIAPAGYFAFT